MRALLLAALLSGCAMLRPLPALPPSYDRFPMARFWRVDADLFSGAQPSPAQLREMVRRYHVRTVIKLSPRWQGRDRVPPGVRLIEHPIPALFTPSRRDVLEILDEIERAQKPVYLHCRTGSDRSGLIVALYRLRHGASVEEARAEMLQHGFRPYRGVARVWSIATAELRASRLRADAASAARERQAPLQ